MSSDIGAKGGGSTQSQTQGGVNQLNQSIANSAEQESLLSIGSMGTAGAGIVKSGMSDVVGVVDNAGRDGGNFIN